MHTQIQQQPVSQIEKKLNASHKKVIEIIRRNRKASRAQIAKETGLSTQSLTRLTKHLIGLGIILEDSKIEGLRGQPAIYLTLSKNIFLCVGVVFEHDRVTVLLDDFNRDNIIRYCEEGVFLSAKKATDVALGLLDKLYSNMDQEITVLGIGVSISGFFTNVEGQICSQQDPIGWSTIDFQEMFAMRYHCHCFVENDGNAASIGFSLTKTGAEMQSFFLLLFTLDVGGGFVFEGRLVDGAFGNAGEISALFSSNGNLPRPTIGSLQQYLSDANGTNVAISDVLAAEDPIVDSWVVACVESMKYPLKAIQSLLDPAEIIFAGRLPLKLQQTLAKNARISSPSFGGLNAPKPSIYVSESKNILEKGVTSIPAFYFFNR
ncbi:MAG: putative NBD/HSP70 family sugar kinase [Psychromonas sp.]